MSWLTRKLFDEKVDWLESWLIRKLIDEKVDWCKSWLMRMSIDEKLIDEKVERFDDIHM